MIALISIYHDYMGELPWIGILCGFVWGAYGISQAFYYNKAKSENIKGGVKYLAVANKLGIIEKDNNIIEEEQLDDVINAEG